MAEPRGFNTAVRERFLIREEHELPTVRLQKVVMENFKCVEHGEVVFHCGKKDIPANTISDLLGIYGQNGSGKTSLIEALSILKYALSGRKIPESYTRCVDTLSDHAHLEFTFDLQYVEPKKMRRTVVYSFNIKSVANVVTEDDSEPEIRFKRRHPVKVKIFDERLQASGDFRDVKQKMQPIMTTFEGTEYAFGPSRKIKEYTGSNKEKVALDLALFKREAAKDSKSFIFSRDTLELLNDKGSYSEYYQILLELNLFGKMFLHVIDKRNSSSDSLYIPFNTRKGIMGFRLNQPTIMELAIYDDLLVYMSSINVVLSHLVPGIELVLKQSREGIDELPVIDGKPDKDDLTSVRLFARRGDREIPLHYESEGIVKLVSILSLVITAFNDQSCTVAIDELDAGIYEYLLGEILIAFEEYGRGQLVFTSHNLRPLEVLKKENLLFTTANPKNRYITLKGVGRTNNLRDLYLREILSSNQEETIYSAVKRYRLVAAFQKAGAYNGEEE